MKLNFILLFVGIVFLAESTGQAQSPRPNIIIILVDDLGYGDVQPYGAAYKTPHLDQLAKDGMRFTNFYAQPTCSPSRAALMTGCYPQRVGIPWVVGPEGPDWSKDKSFVGLHPNEQTLPEILKAKSYATACIGKWHLGHHKQHLPTRHGFDYYFGLPYSNDMWPTNSPDFPDLPLLEGEKVIETNPDQTQLTKRYTEKAVEFIRQNKSKPFFLYLAHSMPHVPIYASVAFKGKSGKGLYADVVQEIDWSVGELTKTLQQNGIDKSTLVIFTSDNGPWLAYGNHAGSTGGLREGKATIFEGGVRVPMIARWPGQIQPGTTCDQVAALFDLLPTLTELADATLPTLHIDGKSILALLLGKEKEARREVHYYFLENELQAVRKGKWKLHLPHDFVHVDVPDKDGRIRQIKTLHIELSLFDLVTAPGEAQNIASSHPDVVEELKRLAEDFREEMNRAKRQPGKS